MSTDTKLAGARVKIGFVTLREDWIYRVIANYFKQTAGASYFSNFSFSTGHVFLFYLSRIHPGEDAG